MYRTNTSQREAYPSFALLAAERVELSLKRVAARGHTLELRAQQLGL
jgi:hypothetical protein